MAKKIFLTILFSILVLSSLALASALASQETRIVGGYPAKHPKRAALGSLYHNKLAPANEGHFCAATLIRPRWALTAGHCLEYINKRGNTDIVFARDDLRFPGGLRRAVVRTYRYPGYKKKSSAWDVALLYLNAAVKKIHPLALRFQKPETGKRLIILGWGQKKRSGQPVPRLQENWVRVREEKECYSYIDSREAFCAATNNGHDICFGDSGGPALDGRGRIRGIISRGGRCGDPDYPGLYSRLAFARSWIGKILKKNPEPPFRRPRQEKRYNPLITPPYAELYSASSNDWKSFSFAIYSQEAINLAEVRFEPGSSFCSLEKVCQEGPWFLEDLHDPNQGIFALYGRSQDRCLRFSWRVLFQEERLPKRQGKKQVCAQSERRK